MNRKKKIITPAERNQSVLDKVSQLPRSYVAHCRTCCEDYEDCDCLDSDMRLYLKKKPTRTKQQTPVKKKATVRKKPKYDPNFPTIGDVCGDCGIEIDDEFECGCGAGTKERRAKRHGFAEKRFQKRKPAKITLVDSEGSTVDASFADKITIRQRKPGCKGIDIRINDDGSIELHGRENSLCIMPRVSNEVTVREIRHFDEDPV